IFMRDLRLLLMSALILLAGSLFPLSGCQAKEQSPEKPTAVEPAKRGEPASGVIFPRAVIDDSGIMLTIPSRPERIISLTMFSDDILLELVEKKRLLGVTAFAGDRNISNIAERVADIDNKLTLNVEIILALQPDIVFVADWSDADKVKQLKDAGITVFLLASPVSIDEIRKKISVIAGAVGEEEKGKELIGRMDEDLKQVAARVSGIPKEERLTVLEYAIWGTSPGEGTTWNELTAHAGLINAVSYLPVNEFRQVPLSKEKLLELDPDILILPGWVYGDPEGAESFFNEILEDPALRTLRAVRSKRVYRMPENLKSSTSHYLAAGIQWLARTAYPDLFSQNSEE
ncbi:MAG TPA: ABC transporter substrate-binding protein, partial [Spirochaetales bacterium]|nr:ABC transporter substrate-binding protein [Spirochaetales bacterium]